MTDRRKKQYDDADKALPDNIEADRRRVRYSYDREAEEIKKNFEPDWEHQCANCMAEPIVPISGLCGPCHFGTIDAILGEWWCPIAEAPNLYWLDDD